MFICMACRLGSCEMCTGGKEDCHCECQYKEDEDE